MKLYFGTPPNSSFMYVCLSKYLSELEESEIRRILNHSRFSRFVHSQYILMNLQKFKSGGRKPQRHFCSNDDGKNNAVGVHQKYCKGPTHYFTDPEDTSSIILISMRSAGFLKDERLELLSAYTTHVSPLSATDKAAPHKQSNVLLDGRLHDANAAVSTTTSSRTKKFLLFN